MKNIFKHTFAVIAGLFALSVSSAFAQVPETLEETIKMYKRIAPTGEEGKYEITLEGFITSTSIVTEITEPIDIVMVIDRSVAVNSHGMNENVVNATKTFLQTVYDLNPNDNSPHNVAMVSFGGVKDCHIVDFTLQPLTLARKTEMDNKLDTFLSGGSDWNYNTCADLGLQDAYDILSASTVATDGRKKIVLFFTAGAPKDPKGQSGTNTFHYGAGINAVNVSHNLKQFTYNTPSGTDNLKVYAVAPVTEIKSDKGGDKDIVRYLNYVSSNYDFSITQSNYEFRANYNGITGGDEAAHDYYRTCDDKGTDLSDIFKKIAQEIAGDIVDLHEETTAVVDIVSDNFIIPDGVTTDDITVEVWKVDPENPFDPTRKGVEFDPVTDENGNVIDGYYNGVHFVYDAEYTEDHPLTVLKPSDNTIQVSGFDFAKADDKYTSGDNIGVPIYGSGNWVGPRTINDTPVYWGRKIVIRFGIELNPDYQGGYVMPSNDISSGFYIDTDGDGNFDEEELIKPFPVPTVDFPSICIVKDGLKVNESAIFHVEGPDNLEYNVVLTQRVAADGKTLYPTYAVLKRLNEGVYKVTETSWSWMYDTTPSNKTISFNVVNGETTGITADYLLTGPDSSDLTLNGTLVIGRQASKDVTVDGKTVNTPFCLLKDLNGEYDSSAVSVLYYFSNERVQTGKPARAEAFAHNQFAGGKASGGTETGESEEEDI